VKITQRLTYTEVGGGEAVVGGGDRRCGRVSEIGVDVGELIAHDTGNIRAHVLRRQAREMSAIDNNTVTNKCVSKMHIRQTRRGGGAEVTTTRSTPPPFQGQHLRR